jgi:hypothetical protein
VERTKDRKKLIVVPRLIQVWVTWREKHAIDPKSIILG